MALVLGDISEESWPLECWELLVCLEKQGLTPLHPEVGSAKQFVRTLCSSPALGVMASA